MDFANLTSKINRFVGSPAAFFSACLSILLWGATGPLFHFSDTWQLLANTGTTLVTFLLGFLIQNANMRQADASDEQMVKLLTLETALDQHINVTAKAHSEELTTNTKLTQEIHAMLTALGPLLVKAQREATRSHQRTSPAQKVAASQAKVHA